MQSQFGTNAIAFRQRVLYEGTDVIREGMPVSFNYDTLENILNYDKGAGGDAPSQSTPTTTADGNQNEGKFLRVELTTEANKEFFAGVVAGTSYAGVTGPKWLDIFIANGAIVPVRTDKSITALDKLYLESGEQTLVNDSSAMPCVAVAVETVDRSSVAGVVLAKLQGVDACSVVESVTAASRTAVQLPTAAIWDNFNLKELRENPFSGALYEADFRRPEDFPADNFVDATYAASAAGKSLTEFLYGGLEAVGDLNMFGTTDNQAVEWQVPCPITVSGGKKWGMEFRIKASHIDDTKIGWFMGLKLAQALAGDGIADGGTLIDTHAVGFQRKEGDGDIIDFVYQETGSSQNEHDDDYVTAVAGTYNTIGMYFNGTTIQGYVDGVLTGTAISAVDIAAADFPTAAVLVPQFLAKCASADDSTVTLDWVRVAQEG